MSELFRTLADACVIGAASRSNARLGHVTRSTAHTGRMAAQSIGAGIPTRAGVIGAEHHAHLYRLLTHFLSGATHRLALCKRGRSRWGQRTYLAKTRM